MHEPNIEAAIAESSAPLEGTVLACNQLHKEFTIGLRLKRVHAVRGVSFSVRPGEIFGYLGPNGAGKTTTMKMAMGLIGTTSGSVTMFGQSVDDPRVRSRVGYLPEHPYFYDYLTAFEILDFYGRLYSIPKILRLKRIDELLEMVGMEYARKRRLRGFSKGMLQRVGIAQSLIADPDLVVLDEPLGGLDPIGRKDIRDLIYNLRERGKTVFFSSHILHDIETICDRVAIINHGKIVHMGSLDQLLSGEGKLVDVLAQVGSDSGDKAEFQEKISAFGASFSAAGPTLTIVVEEAHLSTVLSLLLEAKFNVLDVTARRISLEEFFMREAGAEDGD
jgi:ABC-2 type transport system ATP-binding protein